MSLKKETKIKKKTSQMMQLQVILILKRQEIKFHLLIQLIQLDK